MQQLSHKGLSGTVGSQLQCLTYKTMKQLSLYEAKKHITISTLNVRTLYTFLTADTGARFILYYQLFLKKTPNLMYLV